MNIPDEVVEYVRDIMSQYECADNMRIMPAFASYEESADYEDSRNRGCCGFVDYREFIWNGTSYLYGFNYGH